MRESGFSTPRGFAPHGKTADGAVLQAAAAAPPPLVSDDWPSVGWLVEALGRDSTLFAKEDPTPLRGLVNPIYG